MSAVATPTPLQKSFKPPPEPVDSTFGALKSVDLPKRSATTVANGYTVDEPTILIESRAEAVTTLLIDATTARLIKIFFTVFFLSKLRSEVVLITKHIVIVSCDNNITEVNRTTLAQVLTVKQFDAKFSAAAPIYKVRLRQSKAQYSLGTNFLQDHCLVEQLTLIEYVVLIG